MTVRTLKVNPSTWTHTVIEIRKWFVILPALVVPVTLVINAPFGRFATAKDNIFTVDGRSIILLVPPLTDDTRRHQILDCYGNSRPNHLLLRLRTLAALSHRSVKTSSRFD
jgi:hypothetical protein